MIGDSLMSCPVDGCAWTLSHGDVELKNPLSLRRKPGETLDETINENARRWHAGVEETIRSHVETHDVMEWLTTVRRLQQDLYNVGPTGIRPHVYREG